VLITITKDAYKIVTRLPEPGFRRELHELRFLKKEVEKLASKLKHEAEAPPPVAETATETKAGIDNQVIDLLKIDIEGAELELFERTPAHIFANVRQIAVV